MPFGIPSADQLSQTIKDAISQLQAAGLALEDHEVQALHDQLHTSISELLLGVQAAEGPLLPRIDALTAQVQKLVNVCEGLPGAKFTSTLDFGPGYTAPPTT